MAASPLVLFGIPAIAIVVALLFVLGQYLATRQRSVVLGSLVGAALWLGLTGAVAASGLLGRFDLRPPPMGLMFLAVISLGLWLGLGKNGERLAGSLPLWVLIAVQGFRLPLELVMHQAAIEGVMPHEMSFSGYNFDIVTGSSAIVIGALAARGAAPRWLLVGWNLYGIAALCVIAVVAFMASPMMQAFGSDPAHVNGWVTEFPYVWLPTVLVVAAVAGHVIVWRKLSALAPARRAQPA
ncbi:MAG TPA: hypothetical protein VM686_01895 [Polyangiaceae bacterium]|jgi:hypothetical protein|nr:hypothetical protein [Polyangiaceae bacterium]